MSCDHGVPSSFINDVVSKFIKSVETCRTVDCVLVKLSTAISYLEDYAERPSTRHIDVRSIIDKFLRDIRVREILAGLYPYIDFVRDKIYRDVRFRNLERYADLILDAIEIAGQCYAPRRVFQPIDRPPAWRIESEERRVSQTFREAVYSTSRRAYYKGDYYYEVPVEIIRYSKSYRTYEKNKRRSRFLVLSLVIVFILSVILSIFTLHSKLFLLQASFALSKLVSSIAGFIYSLKNTITLSKSSYGVQRYGYTEIRLGKLMLSVEHNYLVVKYYGRWLPYLWLEGAGYTIYLTPSLVVFNDLAVPADYVFVNSTYSIAKFSISRIISLLRELTDKSAWRLWLILSPVSKKCEVIITNGTLYFGTCEDVVLIVSSPRGKSLEETLLETVNIDSVMYLRTHLLRNIQYSTPVDLAWYILEWLDKNAHYDYNKPLTASVEGPIEFFRKRRGVCADYAVFTATALLAAGFRSAYILAFETEKGPHATAGVIIENTLFILDQHLPIYEWSDYVEYVFRPIGDKVELINITLDKYGQSAIEIRMVSPESLMIKYPDTYEPDRVPSDVVYEAFSDIAEKLHIKFSPFCYFTRKYMWNILNTSYFKAYNPLFHKYLSGY